MWLRQVTLVVVLSLGAGAPRLWSQADVTAELARAERLFQEARFGDAIPILVQVDSELTSAGDRVADRVKAKLFLAMSHLALNETDQAKSQFVELCRLDPGYRMDQNMFSPKVIDLFRESVQSCAGSRYERGRELLKAREYSAALREFRGALEINGDHELARQYLLFAEEELNVAIEAAATEWRKQFSARDFEKAAATFDQIKKLAADATEKGRQAAVDLDREYRTIFESLVFSWNEACLKNNRVALEAIRAWVRNLDPAQTINAEAGARIKSCPER